MKRQKRLFEVIITKLAIAVGVCLVAVACAKFPADRYAISADNVVALRTHKDTKVSVGEFSSFEPEMSEIQCRALGPIFPPDHQTFAAYIRNSLESELKISELYAPDAAVVLTGRLNSIDVGSMSGYWRISLTV